MKRKICILCNKKLKIGECLFCESCVKNRSTDSRLKALAKHYIKANSKYLRR